MMPTADMSPAEFDALVDDAMSMDPAVIARLYNALLRWDASDIARHVRLPTRILAGGRDALVPRATLEFLAAQLKVALEVWPDVGHSPMIERPEAFVAWLLETPGFMVQLKLCQ
jgi:pimeloyl-ACP methyl ester carboxylesterase